MSNLVEINNVELSVKEFNNLRVVTFKDIDKVHDRPEGTAKRNFTTNKKYLVKDEDYFIIKPSDFKKDEIRTSGIYQVNPRGTTFITETGYLMLVKSFTDDLAWKVQRQLVSSYFKTKETEFNNQDISPLISSITSLSAQMITLIEEMTKLKESQNKPKSLPANKFSRWKTNVFNKLKLLQSYVNENSDQELTLPHTMKLVFDELQDTYNIDLSEYTEMYKCEYGLDFDTKVQTLDVINHYKDIRDMFTLTVESIMDRLHITENTDTYSTRNIFDELAAQIDSAKVS